MFASAVDDFGVKCAPKEDAQHSIDALKEHCTIETDWEGKLHCGMTLDWDCNSRTCNLSMPECLQAASQKFQHPQPKAAQDAPHHCNMPQWGQKAQCATDKPELPMLNKDKIKRIQQTAKTFLFCARAIDSTM